MLNGYAVIVSRNGIQIEGTPVYFLWFKNARQFAITRRDEAVALGAQAENTFFTAKQVLLREPSGNALVIDIVEAELDDYDDAEDRAVGSAPQRAYGG